MSRPGTAEGPPLPPPFPFHNKDPDDEVQEIVRDLQHSTYLNPIVDKFLQDPTQKDLFHQAFARQANLIKSRIQSFDVGHVTVYDKVLLRLTDNGNRFDSIAAQEYFCEEFLAISKDGNSIEAEKILDQSLVLKALVARAANPDGKYREKYSAETGYGEKGQKVTQTPDPLGDEDAPEEMNENTARLVWIYERAKSDFENMSSSNSAAKLEAARFLRDTAENTVMHLHDAPAMEYSQELWDFMDDARETCKMAQACVVSLSGGRKRKFDRRAFQVLPRAAKRYSPDRGQPSQRRREDSPPPRGPTSGDRGGDFRGANRFRAPVEEEWSAQQPEFRERSPVRQHYRRSRSPRYRGTTDKYKPGAGYAVDSYKPAAGYAVDSYKPAAGYAADSYKPAADYAETTHAHPAQRERYPDQVDQAQRERYPDQAHPAQRERYPDQDDRAQRERYPQSRERDYETPREQGYERRGEDYGPGYGSGGRGDRRGSGGFRGGRGRGGYY